jgi:hypothetical protein
VLETRWLCWCLVAVDKGREGRPVLGVAWRCSGRKPSTDLVGAGSGGAPASFFFLETLAVELRLHPRWLRLSGRNPKPWVPGRAMAAAASFPSCRYRLGELALFLLLSTWRWMSGQRPRVEDLRVEAAASKTMLGNCFMGRRSCWHGLGGNLVSLVRRGCRLGLRPSGEVV